ncbi:MAG: PAS domain S-box protein [Nitrospira sp.]|nr:PAS domain S-box protein [Nitrospira sp.]
MSLFCHFRAIWRQDLRLRTTVTLSLLLGIILLIATAWRLGEIKTSLEEATQTRAHAIGRTFTILEAAAPSEKLHRIQAALDSYHDDPDIACVDLLGTDRMIIASTEPERVGRTVTDSLTTQAGERGGEIIGYDETSHESQLLVAVEPRWDGKLIAGWIRIEFPLTKMRQQMTRVTRESILLGVLLIGSSILIVLISMHRISVLFRDTADRLQTTLTSLNQRFPDLESPTEGSATGSAFTIPSQCGEIERMVALINHTLGLLTRQIHLIQTSTSWLEHAFTSRTSQLDDAIDDLKRETAERAQAELTLRENETKYRGIFESSRDAIMLLFPPEWKFTACNPATVALFGAESAEHFTSLGPWDVSPLFQSDGELSTSKAPKVIQQAMQEGSHYFEWIHRRINGPTFPATVLLTRITLQGKTGLQATVRNISEQKHAEQVLRDVSEFQKAILDNAGHAIISATPDGIIRVFNPAAELLLGYSAEELVGKETPAIFHDPQEVMARAQVFSAELGIDLQPGFDVFVEKSRRGLPNTHEWTYMRKDGGRLAVLLTITALRNPEGTITSFLGVASDITTLKVVQQELTLAKEAAEAASVAKSQFLANMSHEIRTPMNGVLGMTELLLATPLADKQRHMAHTVRQSAASLLTIINDILDYSKIEAGKLQLEHTDIDLSYLFDDAVKLFSEATRQKGLSLSVEIATGIPTALRGDPTRLKQILLNLIGNAIKFTATGSITVNADCLKRSAEQILLRVTVRDTGIGIPPESQARVFDAFAQADGSTTRKFGGTGLGLTIVKQLVHLMGGTVDLESIPGRGSTFGFTVPLEVRTDNEMSSVLAPPQHTPATLHGKVLLAEDNVVNREIAVAMLELLGCTVDIAEDGQEALAAIDAQSYDLILMDCQMPNLDGLEASRLIREQENRRPHRHRLPILALTASAMEGDREQCLAAGMDGYLTKPFTFDQLHHALAPWLKKAA